MNRSDSPSLPQLDHNPFIRWSFWGRQQELQDIDRYLLSNPPQSCVVIGETFSGKTTLLRALSDPQRRDQGGSIPQLAFVYLDCAIYVPLANTGYLASIEFWWGLYIQAQLILQPAQPPELSKPNFDTLTTHDAYEIKSALETLINRHSVPVILIFDNFEGVASLPKRDSEWLRAIVQQQRCAYVVASRYLLYLLYHHHPENFISPSPLWNLFADPLYLGLLKKQEVDDRLIEARDEARRKRSIWADEDLGFLKQTAGRHPALLRIACFHLFELRKHTAQAEYDALMYRISMDASPICDWLWRSLNDAELQGEPRAHTTRNKEGEELSPFQHVLLAISNDENPIEFPALKQQSIPTREILFTLEQRGIIEQENGDWQPFCEVMRQFVLKQSIVQAQTHELSSTSISSNTHPGKNKTSPSENRALNVSFTYLEGQVYGYLQTHTGKICSRAEIKTAIWKQDQPSDSALQKIIERIRTKIEHEPDNPCSLIAIRGRGYMLRTDGSSAQL